MPVSRPRLKIVRRLGVQLPGLTRKDAERRAFPPGQHGQSQGRRRKSDYRKRLEEKQKVRFQYGITEVQLRRVFNAASKEAGKTGDNMLARLERRLSSVVFRLGFAPTIPAARQLVSHGHVRVNGSRVNRPSYLVDSGDTISLAPSAQDIPMVVETVENGPLVKLPSFLALDPSEKYTGRVIGNPQRSDVPFVVDDSAIVEFYAR